MDYVNNFETHYLTNTLENFEDHSLKKKQDKLLEYVDVNYINELKKTIIKNIRMFKDITRSTLCLNNEIEHNNIVTFMDGVNEYSENLDPRNPDNVLDN